MTTGELVERYAELTGEPVRTRHRTYLIRKIGWQRRCLPRRARRRAAELADDAEIRVTSALSPVPLHIPP